MRTKNVTFATRRYGSTTKCCCFCFSSVQLLGNDTTQQFDDLKVNLSDVNILNNKTRNSLEDLSNSGVDDIEFEAFLNEVTNNYCIVVYV